MVPAEAAADNATVPEPHREPAVVEEMLGMELIVAKTEDLAVEVQPLETAST